MTISTRMREERGGRTCLTESTRKWGAVVGCWCRHCARETVEGSNCNVARSQNFLQGRPCVGTPERNTREDLSQVGGGL